MQEEEAKSISEIESTWLGVLALRATGCTGAVLTVMCTQSCEAHAEMRVVPILLPQAAPSTSHAAENSSGVA